jgi:hypothetical protein
MLRVIEGLKAAVVRKFLGRHGKVVAKICPASPKPMSCMKQFVDYAYEIKL